MVNIKTSVIFPARNEEAIIKDAVLDVLKHLRKKKYGFEILIIANGCTDKTVDIAKKLQEKNGEIRLLRTAPGYGVALKKGLKAARGKFITIFNVDYYDLHLLDLADIDMYGKDIIIGSKRTYWASDHRSGIRKAISLLFNLFLFAAFGFKGSDTHGIKILKREVITEILPRCTTKSDIFYTELIIKAQRAGFNIADFPVSVIEKRPTRFTFTDRVVKTPTNIYLLYKSLQKDKKGDNKELFHDSIADNWEQVINKKETAKRLSVVYNNLLRGTQLKGADFLEVGCGLGYFCEIAKKKGAKVTGIDIGAALIAKCKEKIAGGNFLLASASKLPFKNNSFDIVLCTEVIEHVNNPLKTITELKRVVKPDGVVILTTPNKLFRPIFVLLSILRIRPYHGNESWFYPSELYDFLSRSGFTIEKEHYFNFIYPIFFLDFFERFKLLKNVMINQGYKLSK